MNPRVPIGLVGTSVYVVFFALCGAPIQAQTQKFASHFDLNAPAIHAEVRKEANGEPWQNPERGPGQGLKLFATEESGAVWLGSNEGAARFDRNANHGWDRWQYFHGRRWLLDNEVRNIWIEETGTGRKVWIRTRTGVSQIEWGVRNSHRQDIKFMQHQDRFRRRQLTEVLAPDERAVSKWNGNPYRPDGGAEGYGEDDGAFFLLPYWMGRYHGWVTE